MDLVPSLRPHGLTDQRDDSGSERDHHSVHKKGNLPTHSDGSRRVRAERANHEQIDESQAGFRRTVQDGGPGKTPDAAKQLSV